MAEYKITCQRCGCDIEHICRPDGLKKSILDLYKFRPEIGFPDAMKEGNDWIEKDDKGNLDVDGDYIPFLSEVYLYALLGKEDARTLMALVNNIIREAGLDPHELKSLAYKELDRIRKEQEERKALVAKRKAEKLASQGKKE